MFGGKEGQTGVPFGKGGKIQVIRPSTCTGEQRQALNTLSATWGHANPPYYPKRGSSFCRWDTKTLNKSCPQRAICVA